MSPSEEEKLKALTEKLAAEISRDAKDVEKPADGSLFDVDKLKQSFREKIEALKTNQIIHKDEQAND